MIKLNKENKRAKEEEKKTEEQIPGGEAPKKEENDGWITFTKRTDRFRYPKSRNMWFFRINNNEVLPDSGSIKREMSMDGR